jgi:glycosyltransferase involved in cell wall biosynthesis
VSAWQHAIESLLGDDSRRRSISLAGRERALAKFDWAVVARAHSMFFSQVIAGQVHAPGRAA